MTCIIGMKLDDDVYIAGDSLGVQNLYHSAVRKAPKIFSNGDMIFGYCGSYRMGQLLRFSLTIPHNNRGDDYEYMCTDFVGAVRKCFKDNGFMKTKDGVEGSGGDFLVGYNGNIYNIEGDYQVGIPMDNYDATGSGMYHALGAMSILMKAKKIAPYKILREALETVTEFQAGAVRPPYHVISLKDRTIKEI